MFQKIINFIRSLGTRILFGRTTCSGCNKEFGWTETYYIGLDGGIYCRECAKKY